MDYDERTMQTLLETSCFQIGELDYSLVDQDMFTIEIRVSIDSNPLTLFSGTEATSW